MLENMDSEPNAPPENPEEYLKQLARHERWLATYVYSLVAHSFDAEDVLQEVKLTLWRHFAKFQPDTNFRAWARTIALHQILNFRRSAKRRAGAPLEEVFVEAVALELDRQALALESQSDLLGSCLQKLPEAHRKLILWRYYEDCSVGEIAVRSRRSIEAVYRLLSRIRAVLSACVQRTALEAEAR
jgi:RNA polymerase sigma-70 factor (ECF subfamily)